MTINARSLSFVAALALGFISACGSAEDQIDPEDQTEEILQSVPDAPGEAAKRCNYFTTCSANGSGWTTTYPVGKANSKKHCSDLSVGFCLGLSLSYRFHNSACT